jgi:hypothetical protein
VRTSLQSTDLLVTSSVKLDKAQWSMPSSVAHENDVYCLLGTDFDTHGFVGSRRRTYKGKWARSSLDFAMRPTTKQSPPGRKLRYQRD